MALSREAIQDIIHKYFNGHTSMDIANEYGIHVGTVPWIIRTHGHKSRPPGFVGTTGIRSFSHEQCTNISLLYKSGHSISSIATKVGSSYQTVSRTLKKYGVPFRPYMRRVYSLNENCFKNLSEERNYWTGMMITDGCIMPRRHTYIIHLGLKLDDIDHIKKFATFMGTQKPLHIRDPKTDARIRGSGMVSIDVTSKIMGDDLISLGVVPNKTDNASLPTNLMSDKNVWRGVVDGDGSIGVYNGHAAISLCGSENLVNQFALFVHSKIPECRAKPYHMKKLLYGFQTTGSTAQDIIRVLYDGSTVYLDRKMNLAKQAMSIIYQ